MNGAELKERYTATIERHDKRLREARQHIDAILTREMGLVETADSLHHIHMLVSSAITDIEYASTVNRLLGGGSK
jgi:hypothetical protein